MSRILIVYGSTYGHTERTAAERSTPWEAGRLNLGPPQADSERRSGAVPYSA